MPNPTTLIAYSDASYNHPNAARPDEPLLHTVATYITTDIYWRRFRKEWLLELSKKGMQSFHMTDFEHARNAILTNKPLSRKSPYRGWAVEDFKPFLQRLHRVINRKSSYGSYRMGGFISSLVKSDFDSSVPEDLKNHVSCKSHYIFNMITNFENIARWANPRNIPLPIHYVFAGGDHGEAGNLEGLFRFFWKNEQIRKHLRLTKEYAPNCYEIKWAKQELEIQAADIAAFEFNKAQLTKAKLGKLEDADVRRSLVNLWRTRHEAKLWTAPEMSKAFKKWKLRG